MCLVATNPEGLDPFHPNTKLTGAPPTATPNSEEPLNLFFVTVHETCSTPVPGDEPRGEGRAISNQDALPHRRRQHPEEIAAFVEFIEAHCPVHDTLVNPAQLSYEIA